MPVDKFGRISDAKTRDTGVSLTYINNNYICSDGGTPVSGSINMNGNTLYNVSDPVNPQDVATKEYADKVGGGSPFFKENGNYQTTHAINMAFKKLLNLSTPSEPFEAATKEYVDYVVEKLKESLNINIIDERPRIIAIHSNYCGLLRKGEYQFVFGGNITQPSGGACGFLMLHSGLIKKIKVKISHDEGIENLSNFDLPPMGDFSTIEPIFTFTLIKEEKNLTDFLSYSCFKFSNFNPYYFDRNDTMYGGFTDEEIRIGNEEIDKGITFLDKYGDKITLIEEDIACTFFPIPFTSLEDFTHPNSILNIPISEGDIINIRTEKENASVWGRDISFTYLFTFLIELDPF